MPSSKENPYRTPHPFEPKPLRWGLNLSKALWIWFLIVGCAMAMLNSPRDPGILAMLPTTAGFLWQFATWGLFNGNLIAFDGKALLCDIAVGVAASVVVAFLCSWSRKPRAK